MASVAQALKDLAEQAQPSERQLLGMIVALNGEGPQILDGLSDILADSKFDNPSEHAAWLVGDERIGQVLGASLKLAEEGMAPTPQTVALRLKAMGIRGFTETSIREMVAAERGPEWAFEPEQLAWLGTKLLKQFAEKRAIAKAGGKIADIAARPYGSVNDQLGEIDEVLTQIAPDDLMRVEADGDQAEEQYLQELEHRAEMVAAGHKWVTFPKAWGFGDQPIPPGDAILFTAPTGGGKTAAGASFAINAALNGAYVDYFGL